MLWEVALHSSDAEQDNDSRRAPETNQPDVVSSDEDRPLCWRQKAEMKASTTHWETDSDEEKPLAQRITVEDAARQGNCASMEIALLTAAERAAGVAHFSSSLPPQTRAEFELAYASAIALEPRRPWASA